MLVDSTPGVPGLVLEHGFSCWVATDRGALLFDTGASDALVANARRLGLELATARALVLSHGHYDHTGGIAGFLAWAPHARVHAHPALTDSHRSRSTGADRDVGVPEVARRALGAADVVLRREPVEVLPGIWTTGEIPRHPDEDVGGPFFVDAEGRHPDPLLDDQALVLRHRTGLVVLLGCAHAGVRSTLRHVRGLFPSEPVRGVVGGMHLVRAAPARLAATVGDLLALDDALVGPAHCTGSAGVDALRVALGRRYHHVVTGSELVLDPSGEWR